MGHFSPGIVLPREPYLSGHDQSQQRHILVLETSGCETPLTLNAFVASDIHPSNTDTPIYCREPTRSPLGEPNAAWLPAEPVPALATSRPQVPKKESPFPGYPSHISAFRLGYSVGGQGYLEATRMRVVPSSSALAVTGRVVDLLALSRVHTPPRHSVLKRSSS